MEHGIADLPDLGRVLADELVRRPALAPARVDPPRLAFDDADARLGARLGRPDVRFAAYLFAVRWLRRAILDTHPGQRAMA
jgi:hypothetical protein